MNGIVEIFIGHVREVNIGFEELIVTLLGGLVGCDFSPICCAAMESSRGSSLK